MVSEMRLEQTFDLRCLHRVYSWIPTMHILHLTENKLNSANRGCTSGSKVEE